MAAMVNRNDEELSKRSVGFFFVVLSVFMVATAMTTMAFSALKLDFKAIFAWDEPTLGIVASMNSLGVGFVVHLGWLYDRSGTKVTLVTALAMKCVGLSGLAIMAVARISQPWLFGACCLLEGQGTGAIIIAGQSEVMRNIPPPRSGTALACVKTAIGFGPALWSSAYVAFMSPRVDALYAIAAVLVAIGIGTFLMVLPESNRERTDGCGQELHQKKGESHSMKAVLMSFDSFVICFTASTIIWGTSLFWTSNLSTFAVAAGQRYSIASIQTSFFATSGMMRLAVGMLLDALPRVRTETWTALFSGCMVVSSLLMWASSGNAVRLAAPLAGGAWGAAATVDPILCRTVAGKHQATLYSMGKVAGMLWSMLWVRMAAAEAKSHTPAGATDCVGASCFQNTWTFVTVVCAPMIICTSLWAAQRARKQHEHAE